MNGGIYLEYVTLRLLRRGKCDKENSRILGNNSRADLLLSTVTRNRDQQGYSICANDFMFSVAYTPR